jgi:hypothetical protein
MDLWTLEFEQKFKSGEAQSYISGFLNSGPYISHYTYFLLSSFMLRFCISYNVFQNAERNISTVFFHNFRTEFQVSSGLLQEKGIKGSSLIGHFLGWGMAAIYIGGRFPQIFLNVSFTIEVAYMASAAEVYGTLYEQIAKKEKSLNSEEIEVRFESSPISSSSLVTSYKILLFLYF